MENNAISTYEERVDYKGGLLVGSFNTVSELKALYERLQAGDFGSKSDLPEWAVEAVFTHHKSMNDAIDKVEDIASLFSQYFVSHSAVALDIYFDNIVCNHSKTARFLIYMPAR